LSLLASTDLSNISARVAWEIWLAGHTVPVRRQVALTVIKAGMESAQDVARFEANVRP